MPATTLATPPSLEARYGTPKAEHLRLPEGVYVPTLAFFTDSEEVDTNTLERHLVRLINAGVAGIVVHGSNGEAVHLTREERSSMIRCAADTIHQEGHDVKIPLIAGYYGSLLDDEKIVQHFYAVADESPIPLLVYNFPAAASGRDLTSDAIVQIAQHPNVVGVKLTCGNTGKLARVVDDVPEGFFVAGGSADFILQGQVVGGHGTISGLANIAPRACVRIMELFSQGKLAEARRLQAVVAKGDWVAIKTGFVGVKAAIGHFEQYGGAPRKPCVGPSALELKTIAEGLSQLHRLERELEEEAAGGGVH
ncbi:dihydrodipicolinate synthase [Colletotrichum tofieldiae]|nr:dihydrodipicolinate synthase [Colletotrichum tofieldiae]